MPGDIYKDKIHALKQGRNGQIHRKKTKQRSNHTKERMSEIKGQCNWFKQPQQQSGKEEIDVGVTVKDVDPKKWRKIHP